MVGDGGIVNSAIVNGNVVKGADLDQALVNYYRVSKEGRSSNIRTPFPNLTLSDQDIISACRYIKQNKACTFDGINSALFKLPKDQYLRDLHLSRIK